VKGKKQKNSKTSHVLVVHSRRQIRNTEDTNGGFRLVLLFEMVKQQFWSTLFRRESETHIIGDMN
jgi:hypothetical protein